MKKKALFLCLLAYWLQITAGSGDLGDFGDKVISLPQEQVDKYLTQDRVVGRDKEQEQCSQDVFHFRKKMEVCKYTYL